MKSLRCGYPARLLQTLVLLAPISIASCGKTVADTIDDAGITTEVKTVLLNDLLTPGMRIDVETVQGVVTLSGTVKTGAERDKAVALARKVKGVRDVKSELKVSQGP